jgi:uridylate kinase
MVLNKIVISLGGSLIVPEKVDYEILERFKKIILTNRDTKFVVVTGGGNTARKYIEAYQKLKQNKKLQSLAGISITQFHAQFLMYYFGKPANDVLPHSIKKVKNLLGKNKIVFCGGLRNYKKQTTDATAAQIAKNLNCPFINITNVKGIYSDDPKKNKKARFIKEISWEGFEKMAKKIKFKAGQHFVLDQKASEIINKNKISTYITNNLGDIDLIINEKSHKGSLIKG